MLAVSACHEARFEFFKLSKGVELILDVHVIELSREQVGVSAVIYIYIYMRRGAGRVGEVPPLRRFPVEKQIPHFQELRPLEGLRQEVGNHPLGREMLD
jgi:hypothetical protein